MTRAPFVSTLTYGWLARSIEALPAVLRSLELQAPPGTRKPTAKQLDRAAETIERSNACLRFMAEKQA